MSPVCRDFTSVSIRAVPEIVPVGNRNHSIPANGGQNGRGGLASSVSRRRAPDDERRQGHHQQHHRPCGEVWRSVNSPATTSAGFPPPGAADAGSISADVKPPACSRAPVNPEAISAVALPSGHKFWRELPVSFHVFKQNVAHPAKMRAPRLGDPALTAVGDCDQTVLLKA